MLTFYILRSNVCFLKLVKECLSLILYQLIWRVLFHSYGIMVYTNQYMCHFCYHYQRMPTSRCLFLFITLFFICAAYIHLSYSNLCVTLWGILFQKYSCSVDIFDVPISLALTATCPMWHCIIFLTSANWYSPRYNDCHCSPVKQYISIFI